MARMGSYGVGAGAAAFCVVTAGAAGAAAVSGVAGSSGVAGFSASGEPAAGVAAGSFSKFSVTSGAAVDLDRGEGADGRVPLLQHLGVGAVRDDRLHGL